MAAYCIENAWHIYCNCRYFSTFEIHGVFLVFLLIDEQRNILYVEFEFAENYTRLLQNTCFAVGVYISPQIRILHINRFFAHQLKGKLQIAVNFKGIAICHAFSIQQAAMLLRIT